MADSGQLGDGSQTSRRAGGLDHRPSFPFHHERAREDLIVL